MKGQSYISPASVFCAIIASLGGFLFGYNTSVISGALLFLTEEFSLDIWDQSIIVSTLLFGALIGALLGGTLSDYTGRKVSLFFTVLLYIIGNVLMVFAEGVVGLLLGRFILGLAVGISSLVVPLYIAETSPPKWRGALVSFNQLAIVTGILIAYIVNYAYSDLGEWRYMFGMAFIPGILFFIGLFFIPESPSWLSGSGKIKKAKEIMKRINPKNEEFTSMEGKKDTKMKEGWGHLFDPKVRKALIAGIGISIIQQLSGINIVIYYAPKIFQFAGFSSAPSAIFATIGIGIINLIATIIALWIIDRMGRKVLLAIGLLGMTACLILLGFAFYEPKEEANFTALISLMAYVGFFAVSLGPITWLLISEVFPLSIRGRAMGIASFSNWTFNYLISLSFLGLVNLLGASLTFWLYGVICLLSLWFIYKNIPETKNRTFEEIQIFWQKKKKMIKL